ncbi:MAG: hypothetical protein Q4F63_06490 [Clostridia bacterium]|nr:hypothetical protein [Clostridia bacterium]
MKKILFMTMITAMLAAENKTWLGIMDLYIDNRGNAVSGEEIRSIENVNVKFRIEEIFEKIFNGDKEK